MPLRLFLLALLVGCGTDSTTTSSTNEENPSIPAIKPQIAITATAAKSLFVDSDTNDPQATFINNNTLSNAQRITAPSRTLGFVTKGGTGKFEDRFFIDEDINDVYQVQLITNDHIQLMAEASSIANLDLFLFDNAFNLIKYSNGLVGNEFIQIDQSGDYYVVITAQESLDKLDTSYGIKYELVISPTVTNNLHPKTNQSAAIITDEAIVSYKPSTGYSALSTTNKKASKLHKIRLNQSNTGIQTLSYKASAFKADLQQKNPKALKRLETLSKIQQLKNRPEILTVDPNSEVKLFSNTNDPLRQYQWYLDTIKHPEALLALHQTPLNETIVAVIDNGLYLEHEELTNQLVAGFDFISNINAACDGDGIDNDPSDPGDGQLAGNSTFHGSHVAGIIAASSNNAIGITGVAPNVKIMPLRVIGCDKGSTYDVMQAIRFAAGLSNDSGTVPEKPADIINLSLGSYTYSASFQNLIREVTNKGIIVVAAAGNDATNSPAYPAAFDKVISVAATNSVNQSAPYSNFGNSIDIAAPGGDFRLDHNNDGYSDGILSLYKELSGRDNTSSYRQYQGTSMAAPQVAAALAIMKGLNSALNSTEAEQLLIQGQVTKNQNGHSTAFGYGILDLEKSVRSQLDDTDSSSSIYTSHSQIYLSQYQPSASISLGTFSDSVVKVIKIESADTRLTISADNIDSNGIGDYEITANIDALELGQHTSSIQIATDQGQQLTILVHVNLREANNSLSDTGLIWLLLLDPITKETLYQFTANPDQGIYNFPLNDIKTGEYLVVAGSDIDNDLVLCTTGEVCGAYPNTASPAPVSLSEDQALEVNFTLDASRLTTFQVLNKAIPETQIRKTQRIQ
ncbi:MAG: S8 family serine peptidase [Cellvibrionales bacterium]|nr:S8 family serine peptidase [Cellvibrionales bacterium]